MNLNHFIQEAQQGNQEAFTQLCRQFAPLVKKYAFQPHLRNIAEEAQSQGWLALVEAVKNYDVTGKIPFAGFAESKVKYAVWNLFKKERRRWQQEWLLEGQEEEGVSAMEGLPDAMNVEADWENRCLSQELAQGLAALPARQRGIILRNVIGGESLTQLAERMGITVQAAHALKKRGLTRLKKLCPGR